MQRKISVVTSLGKTYTGMVDIPNPTFRTTDLLNSSQVFWKDPGLKCFENCILLKDVKLSIDEKTIYKRYKQLQVRVKDIIFFYDDSDKVSDKGEKARASSIKEKSYEESMGVNIITPVLADSFYDIHGTFYGLFKKKTKDKFIPLSDVHIYEIQRSKGRWLKKDVPIAHNFAGVGTEHIEAIYLDEIICTNKAG